MFDQVRNQVRQQFEIMRSGPLFSVAVDREEIWNTYLKALPAAMQPECSCNACRSFMRQFGGIVAIKPDNTLQTLWDFEAADPDYAAAVKAVRKYVARQAITGPFYADAVRCGTERNADLKRDIVWTHFYIDVPQAVVVPGIRRGPLVGTAAADQHVLLRSMQELTPDAVQTTLELIAQGTLYRGAEFRPVIEKFQALMTEFQAVPAGCQTNWSWRAAAQVANKAVVRMRNTAIGQLLQDLSEGRELDAAVSAFERIMAPANYKRPKALVTPRMIDEAKKRITDMGLLGALARRVLTPDDLNVTNALFVYRAAKRGADIFESMKQQVRVNPRELSKVDTISVADFVTNVLPGVKHMRALVLPQHAGNFVTLLGPQNREEPSLFAYGNSFGWSYTGGVADSVKQRVKQAGGKVDGVVRISLSWSNYDDLDLHVIEPHTGHIYYGDKRGDSGGVLDLDMNAGSGTSRTPVENICWVRPPKLAGTYLVYVHNFWRRENEDQGFTVEIEYDGQIHTFSRPKNGNTTQRFDMFSFECTRDGQLTNVRPAPGVTEGGSAGVAKWGIQPNQFHRVDAITLSPNFWNGNHGNKHFMFFLEGCRAEETPRGFYNEFLRSDLADVRKVFEVLGSSVAIERSPTELAGIGFSETQRAELYLEVEGAFKRTIKVQF